MNTTTIPKELLIGTGTGPISSLWGPRVEKTTIDCIHEIQSLEVAPWTTIKHHGHEPDVWEIWLNLSDMTAFVCLKGEEHRLCNNRSIPMRILAVKGTENYTYDQLANFLQKLGFKTSHGSLIVTE